ncbi:MAG: hypothetical protein C4327_15080, partial [Meiothermus sp.]
MLGAIPRTSAFEWKWEWGPPEEGKARKDINGRTILINPEATLLITPPEGREREFAREYYQRIKKEQPLKAEKDAIVAQRDEVWPEVMETVKAGGRPTGPAGERYGRLMENLADLQRREAAEHAKAHMEGKKLAPLGWYEPDTRGNYDVGEGWQWGRLTTTPNGIH